MQKIFLTPSKRVKPIPWNAFLTGLGIRHVGTKAAKELAQHFGNMKALQEASIEQLLEIDGLGDIIAYSVKTYFEQPSVQELIQELQDRGVNMSYLGKTKAMNSEAQDIF